MGPKPHSFFFGDPVNTLYLTLSGPGATFDDVYLTIAEALKARGYDVRIDNEHPPQVETLAEFDELMAKNLQDYRDYAEANKASMTPETYEFMKRERPPAVIQFNIEHCPWGG